MYCPTCCCTEQGATCANRKMRPDDLLMHGLYKVGLRLKASESSQRCERRAINSAKRKKRPRIRIGSSSQWIITVAILRPVQWFRPSTNTRSKDSLMHHKKACCCMLLWNLGSVQERPGARVFRKLALLRISAFISCPKQLLVPFLTSLPCKAAQLRQKITKAVMFIKKNLRDSKQGNMKCCYAFDRDWLRWSHWIFWQESVLLIIQGQKPAQTFNPTWYSRADVARAFQTFLQSEHRLVAFLQHIKWHICSVGAWKYLTWCE